MINITRFQLWSALLACVFAAMCAVTIATRVYWGWEAFMPTAAERCDDRTSPP